MESPIKVYKIEKANSRCFTALLNLFFSTSLRGFAGWVYAHPHKPVPNFLDYMSSHINEIIRTPTFSPDSILYSTHPTEFEISILGAPPEYMKFTNVKWETDEVKSFSVQVESAILSLYFDQVREWLATSNLAIANNYPKWPKCINFARVVRNACLHGGTITYRGKNPDPVEWRGFKISIADRGKNVFDILGDAEMILLTLDIEEELTKLGAPIPLP